MTNSYNRIVRIYVEDDQGTYFDDKETIGFEDFGDVVPAIGDRIFSGQTFAGAGVEYDPFKQVVWRVVARYFWPKGHKGCIALVVRRDEVSRSEYELI